MDCCAKPGNWDPEPLPAEPLYVGLVSTGRADAVNLGEHRWSDLGYKTVLPVSLLIVAKCFGNVTAQEPLVALEQSQFNQQRSDMNALQPSHVSG